MTTATEVNTNLWTTGNYVTEYANRVLRPAEIVALARYSADLSQRVLELGCGAGRVLGYLLALSADVVGIDVSPAMLAYCRDAYPEADLRLGDLGALSESLDADMFGAVVAADNILDIFEDAERRRVLGAIRELLVPGGLLIFSSHNLANKAFVDLGADTSLGSKLLQATPARVARAVRRMPRRLRNRRRLAAFQYYEGDYAILNDPEGDYGVLHYYIRRDNQERQLLETGFELVECLDVDGRTVPPGQAGWGSWLYYVARRAER